jgi:tetratricopeptide (TPR) repeat protein
MKKPVATKLQLITLALFACLLITLSACKSKTDQADGNAVADSTPSTSNSIPPGKNAREYFDLGVEAYKNDNDEEAVMLLKESVRLDPGFAEAHYRLGLAHSALGQVEESEKAFEEAVKAYRESLKNNPTDGQAQYMLGLALAKLGKYDEAVRTLREAVKNSSDDDDKYYELGLAHSKLANYREAVAAFNKALELNPDNFPAADALEKARAGLERREDFLEHQEKLRKEKEKQANMNANMNANAATPTNANQP